MHIKPIKISKEKLTDISIIVLSIIVSFLFGYFFGYLHHLYITREPIEFIGEINPGGCANKL